MGGHGIRTLVSAADFGRLAVTAWAGPITVPPAGRQTAIASGCTTLDGPVGFHTFRVSVNDASRIAGTHPDSTGTTFAFPATPAAAPNRAR